MGGKEGRERGREVRKEGREEERKKEGRKEGKEERKEGRKKGKNGGRKGEKERKAKLSALSQTELCKVLSHKLWLLPTKDFLLKLGWSPIWKRRWNRCSGRRILNP